ncbi:Mur ligase family protein [Algiphilus sp.]|uniref:Mur ligase family protein n=1 Tax=Algiphilus sp. TaxID=1872431 RepID=UPI0025B9DF8F|nr:Mur ligase family protein [Algiphilus sp.]MCK5769039.1 hypothetical protein [Algiphilus sp.]
MIDTSRGSGPSSTGRALVWSLDEILQVTGGALLGPAPTHARLGRVVYPMPVLRDGDILLHCDAATWPRRPRKLSGQARMTMDGLLDRAAARRAGLVITSGPVPENPPLPVLHVPNSYEALFQLAAHARARFEGRVISVTGTAGKSTTRDLLAALLSRRGHCVASFANWNTVEGSAMCLASLPRDADYCVVEQSEESIRGHHGRTSLDTVYPHELVVTALGLGNLSRFPTVEALARVITRQIERLPGDGWLFVEADAEGREILEAAASTPVCTSDGAGFGLACSDAGIDGMTLRLLAGGGETVFRSRVFGDGWLRNMRMAARVAIEHGVSPDAIADTLSAMAPKARKMEPVSIMVGGRDATLVDDSYNAEERSYVSALRSFADGTRDFAKRIVIAGKIVNIEGGEKAIYGTVASAILADPPDRVILFGADLEHLAAALAPSGLAVEAETPEAVVAVLEDEVADSTAILLKGSSRNTRLTELSRLLRA